MARGAVSGLRKGAASRNRPTRSLQDGIQQRMLPLVQEYQFQQSQIEGLQSDVALREEEVILAYIRTSDRELARTKDWNLRTALANVIQTVRREGTSWNDNDGNEDSGSEEFEPDVPMMEVKNTNSLNRSILGVYGQHKPIVDNPPTSVATATTAGPTPAEETNNAGEPAEGVVRTVEIEETEVDVTTAEGRTRTNKRRQRDTLSGQEPKKRRSALPASEKWPTPTARLSDLGGMDGCVEEVLKLIGMPVKHPEIYSHIGTEPPRGILFHGPPGCGKTMLAHAIAGEFGVPFINISAPSVVSGMSGESEKKLREIFEEAKELAPCILFIDEIDAITPKRETAQREMERRIVAQLLTCMNDLSMEKTDGKPVIVIGATNRPDSLDPALRRGGRFDREISIGVPDQPSRLKILEKLCSKLRLSGDLDLNQLAKMTPGYVGADLSALTAEAGMLAVSRFFSTLKSRIVAPDLPELLRSLPVAALLDANAMEVDSISVTPSQTEAVALANASEAFEVTPPAPFSIAQFLSGSTEPLTAAELEPLCILEADFTAALKKVQPSAKREGFATVPDVSWEDVGALTGIREELQMAIVEPIRNPEQFAHYGIAGSMGVLLWGPPGCGKTLLAKAVANETCCNFISVKGPELLNKYVGESERAVRTVFARARASSPCVIFFDELDALCPARSKEAESQSSSRLVNALLTEMDGMEGRKDVYVIAATNRPDMIDPAMLRGGRLGKLLYVDLPSAPERAAILATVGRKTPLADDVDLMVIASDTRCEAYSGADLAALIREAAVAALREGIAQSGLTLGASMPSFVNARVHHRHFDAAFGKTAPSVSAKDRRRYEHLRVQLSRGPAS
ncbi:hypothetical protein HKX48_003743 [Thoreauomyces humboldtii]|nr:hypothetical protein HKX48_003743 [Thoreauomyces humboldtii]